MNVKNFYNMEKKINIAKLLKDCPIGTKLYSPLCGECRILNIYDGLGFDVICGNDTVYNFSYDGRYNIMGECCIFPSKENRDWSKFQRSFKDGDVVATMNGSLIGITKGGKNNVFIPTYCVIDNNDEFEAYLDRKEEWAFNRLATEEEMEKLFQAIKDNGYKWNAETKTLEKLPKFKVGDKIRHDDGGLIYTIDGIYGSIYGVKELDCGIPIAAQDDWELVPTKFDITNLRPFDNCKYSLDNGRTWKFAQYWYIMDNYKIDDIKIELWQD